MANILSIWSNKCKLKYNTLKRSAFYFLFKQKDGLIILVFWTPNPLGNNNFYIKILQRLLFIIKLEKLPIIFVSDWILLSIISNSYQIFIVVH